MSVREIIKLFSDDIDNGDFNVAALVADESACDWAYSIGLSRCYGHPELIVVGLDAPVAGAIIEVLGQEIAKGRSLAVGEKALVSGPLQMEVRSVDPLWLARGDWFELGREVMSTWGDRWPDTYQLVWRDLEGNYPEVEGDPQLAVRQPLLSGVAAGK